MKNVFFNIISKSDYEKSILTLTHVKNYYITNKQTRKLICSVEIKF